MFVRQHQWSKEKLTENRSPRHLVNVATLPCKMERSPSRSTTTTKRDKISPKNRSLLVHIAELSTPVVEVAIKVIKASLTQNPCFQCVTPPLTHVGIPRQRDATELNNDGMIKSGDVHYQSPTEFINFSERDIIKDDSSFCSHILLAIDLLFHVFTFEKLLLNVRLCL